MLGLGLPTVAELMERFLTWLGRYRSDRTQEERRRHLQRFCDAHGGLTATSVTASHLETFQDDLATLHALDYVKKHVTSVRAMFSRGAKLGWLPHNFRPFASVEPIRLPAKPLLEADLPTVEEVEALLRDSTTFRGLDDLLRVYYATGARTHELTAARVGDFPMRSMPSTSRVTCALRTSAAERGTVIGGSGRHDPSGSTNRFAVQTGMPRHTPS